MIESAVAFQEASCRDSMTDISAVNFTLELDTVLTRRTLKFMKKCSKLVPIIELGDKNRIIGALVVQSCLGVDPEEGKTVK